MLNVVKERIEHTPWPQATVAHMQYGGRQEETKEESHGLYVRSAAAGFRNTGQVPMLSVAAGPHQWRLPDRPSWEQDFLANIRHDSLGAWHVKHADSELLVLEMLYAAAPLCHDHTQWTKLEEWNLHDYIRDYNAARDNKALEYAAPPLRQLMQIYTMAYEDLLARNDPLRGYASPWSTMGVHACQASAYHPKFNPWGTVLFLECATHVKRLAEILGTHLPFLQNRSQVHVVAVDSEGCCFQIGGAGWGVMVVHEPAQDLCKAIDAVWREGPMAGPPATRDAFRSLGFHIIDGMLMDRYDVAMCSDSDPAKDVTEKLKGLMDNQWRDNPFCSLVASRQILGDVSTIQLTDSAMQVGRWVQVCRCPDKDVDKWKSLERCAFTATVPRVDPPPNGKDGKPRKPRKPCSCFRAWRQVCFHHKVDLSH